MVQTDVSQLQAKITQLRQLMTEMNTKGLFLTLQKNFSWLTSGRGFINSASEESVGKVLITPSQNYLICNNIEAERLQEEEGITQFKVETFPWYQPEQLERIVQDRVTSSDYRADTDLEIEAKIKVLRTTLNEQEKDQILKLGQDTAHAIEQVAFELRRGESELEISARLAQSCMNRGIEPIVNLVAVDERTKSRRHPLQTSKKLDKYVLLVIGGRRRGQIVSVSRLVHFGAPSAELLAKLQAVANIDAALIHHTRPGVTFQDLFQKMTQAYQEFGYPDEWNYHHQGGLSGFNTREQLLLPHVDQKVGRNQVFAWNPSISGVKSEDTLLVTDKGNQLLSVTGNYPMVTTAYDGIERPGILVREEVSR